MVSYHDLQSHQVKMKMWNLKRKKYRNIYHLSALCGMKVSSDLFQGYITNIFLVDFFFLTLKTASDPLTGFWRSTYWKHIAVVPIWEDPAVHSNVGGWLSQNVFNQDLWLYKMIMWHYLIKVIKYKQLQSPCSSLRQHITLLLFYRCDKVVFLEQTLPLNVLQWREQSAFLHNKLCLDCVFLK